MDEVSITYFNPILIVPVLSAVVGAILVFVFGFKRPNEPRFQSSSSIDSLKKSKRKGNVAKAPDNLNQSSKQQNVSSAKVGAGKRDAVVAVTSKKGLVEKSSSSSSSNNNNNTSSSNQNVNKKKTDEKKSENGSPTKKVANKKTGKESSIQVSKKSKGNKHLSSDSNEKPADFDDGGWFTVQSKSTKQKNKVDDSVVNQTENASPKIQNIKNNKSTKVAKAETKQSVAQVISTELKNASENLETEQPAVGPKSNENAIDAPAAPAGTVDELKPTVIVEDSIQAVEQKTLSSSSVPLESVEVNKIENAIVFDELGEWTDAKPERKRGNKKKSRKD